jgi:hypothetical protein
VIGAAVRVSMTVNELLGIVAGALVVGVIIGLLIAWRNRD